MENTEKALLALAGIGALGVGVYLLSRGEAPPPDKVGAQILDVSITTA